MPLLTDEVPEPAAVMSLVAAVPGWRVDAYAPRGTDIKGVPTPSHVVAWVLTADALESGGALVEPVFCAAGRTWTPAQFRAVYGESIELKVVPA